MEKGRPSGAWSTVPRGALRGHASLTCVWFCVTVRFAMSQAAAVLRAARTKILKAVFLSSGWGDADILFFPMGFVCAFSRWCAPERSCALGTVHMRTRSPVWRGSEGSLPGRGIQKPRARWGGCGVHAPTTLAGRWLCSCAGASCLLRECWNWQVV